MQTQKCTWTADAEAGKTKTPTNEGIDTYSEFAERSSWKGGDILQKHVFKKIHQKLVHLKKKNRIGNNLLEIGAGTGIFGKVTEELGVFKYLGAEPNGKLAEIARKRINQGRIIERSLPNLKIEPLERADISIAIHVIEHAEHGYEAREWIAEIKRSTKKGGLVVIISPDISEYKYDFWRIDWSHCFPTSHSALSQIMKDLGIEVLESSKIRGGSANILRNIISKLVCKLLPTKLIDSISHSIIGRELATGLKVGYLYGNAYVVGRIID